jgi:hypothetical protein
MTLGGATNSLGDLPDDSDPFPGLAILLECKNENVPDATQCENSMNFRTTLIIWAIVTLVTSVILRAAEVLPGTAPGNGIEAVETWIRKVSSAPEAATATPIAPKIIPVEGDALRRTFPEDQFFAVRYMRFPRAVTPPAPLELENLVRVRKDGTVKRIEGIEGLKAFLGNTCTNVRDAETAQRVAAASLELAKEFYQDGNYKFSPTSEGISSDRKANHLIVTGKITVTEGGRGEITVSLPFDASGHLKVGESKIVGRLRPDVRLR